MTPPSEKLPPSLEFLKQALASAKEAYEAALEVYELDLIADPDFMSGDIEYFRKEFIEASKAYNDALLN